ncbi:MAG TPA: hypothetical protein VF157_14335 [Chloroflexota bacterium]
MPPPTGGGRGDTRPHNHPPSPPGAATTQPGTPTPRVASGVHHNAD